MEGQAEIKRMGIKNQIKMGIFNSIQKPARITFLAGFCF